MNFTEQIIEAAKLSRPGEIVTIDFDPESDWMSHYNVAWAKVRGEFEGSITIANDQTSNVVVITNRFSEVVDPGISIIDTVGVDDIQDLDTERDIELDWDENEEED